MGHLYVFILLSFHFYFVGAVARSNAFYGRGTGPILRDRVTCTGQETRLRDCTFFTPDYYDSHYEDAGVQCSILGTCTHKIYVLSHIAFIHFNVCVCACVCVCVCACMCGCLCGWVGACQTCIVLFV